MPIPMPSIRRSRSMVLAVALALTGTAHGGGLSLVAKGDAVFVCSTVVERSYGPPVQSRPMRVDSHEPVAFDLGALPPGEKDDSPQFRRLTLRCWPRAPTDFDAEPREGEASYSIGLLRDDSLWKLGGANGAQDYWPPHDRRMVRFTLEPTGDPARPLHIVSASALDEVHGSRDYIVPAGWLTLDPD